MPSILKNRVNFASAKKTPEYPDFLDIQIKSFQDFFQLETKSAERAEEGLFNTFKEKNVTYLKADWTNRNAEIAGQIEKYNRSGIPLYIYWDKTLDEPIVLNEILTENYLMEVVDEI